MDYQNDILSKQDAQVIWKLMRIPSVMTGFYSLHAGYFFMILLSFFFKINFFGKILEYRQSVKQFGFRSGRRFDGPDLGPNFCKGSR